MAEAIYEVSSPYKDHGLLINDYNLMLHEVNNHKTQTNFHSTNSEIITNSELDADQLVKIIKNSLETYRYDHYRYYPALDLRSWQSYFLKRFTQFVNNKDNILFYDVIDDLPIVLGVVMSRWDEEHFGYKMAKIDLVYSHEKPSCHIGMGKMLANCLSLFRDRGVKFVSARMNGDMTSILHLFESSGFHYIENIVWPVVSCKNVPTLADPRVRLMRESDIDRMLSIAARYQYQRGHYHCDEGFDREIVNSLYAKWVRTSVAAKEPVAVIEHEGNVVGYFVFKVDEELSDALGYKYGRMLSLALDADIRSRGLGKSLFQGVMSIMKGMGARYIDSGYATKNHLSAALHTINSFFSKYEEITLHAWLK